MLKKRVLTILELNCNQHLGHREDKSERLPSYAHVVYTTAKQVISRRRKKENVCKISKDEICTCKACNKTVVHCQICKFVGFVAAVVPIGRLKFSSCTSQCDPSWLANWINLPASSEWQFVYRFSQKLVDIHANERDSEKHRINSAESNISPRRN